MRSSTPTASSSASIRRKVDPEHPASTSPVVRRRTPSGGTRSSSLDCNSNNTSAEQFPNNNTSGTFSNNNNNNLSALDGIQNSSTYYSPEFGTLHDVYLRSTQFRQFFEDTLTGETIASEIVEECIVGPVLQRIVTQTCDDLSVPWTVQWFVAQMNEVALMYLTELEGKTATTAKTSKKSPHQKKQGNEDVAADSFSRQQDSLLEGDDDDDDDVESSILDYSDNEQNAKKGKQKIHQIEPIRPILVSTDASSSPLAQKNSTDVFSPVKSQSSSIPSMKQDDNSIVDNFMHTLQNLDNNNNQNSKSNTEHRHVHVMEESDNNNNNNNNFIFTGFASNSDEINQKPKRVREPMMLDEDSWCRGSIKTVPRKEKPSQQLDPDHNNSQIEITANKSSTTNNNNYNTSRSSNIRSRSNSAAANRTKANKTSPGKHKDDGPLSSKRSTTNQTPDHLAGADGDEQDISIIPEFQTNGSANNKNNNKITRPFSAKVGSLSRPATATSGQNNSSSSFVSKKIDSVRGTSSALSKVTMPNLLPKTRASFNNHNNNSSSSTPSSVLRLIAADNTNQAATAAAGNSNFLSLDEEALRNMTSSARAEYETEKEFQQGIQERRQIMNQLRETSKSADEIIQHNSNTSQNAIPSVFTARPQTPIFLVDKVASAPNLNLSSVNLGGGTSLSGVYNMTMTASVNTNNNNKTKQDSSFAHIPANNNSSLTTFNDVQNLHPQSSKSHRDVNNSKSMIINITDEKELQEARIRLEADEKEALRLSKMKNRRVPLGGGGGSRPSSSLSKLMRGGGDAATIKTPSPDLFFVPEKKPGAAGSASMIRNIVPAAGVTSKIVDQSTK